jgi:ArsR family transcriptional regulator
MRTAENSGVDADPKAVGAAETNRMVDFVPFFKAFCNSTRAQIIEFLLGGERCVCEMTGPLDQSQPLVSHHLALLRDAGLLRMRNEGARTYYSIDWDRFDGDLTAFLAYVQELREAPTTPATAGSACATREKAPARRKAS